eukprot:CAMPEP_0113480848 /NCGR_PEP_ID=MMETSP0014_2-20120614/22092_1 /TAXON_ID=2857 /ORGANISM="Nitzschia sp." /LENGTH=753 /DNA_ID=CAMNT_0000374301 /DNA_START=178 /DNA_END=2439 /DNA_ORIENTATION=+ /assembly_acc=CAM_ASM_000159
MSRQDRGGDDDEKYPPDLDDGGFGDVNVFEGLGGDDGDFLPDGIEDLFSVNIDNNNNSAAGPGADRHNSILQVETLLMAAENAGAQSPPPPPPPAAAAAAGAVMTGTNDNNYATRNNSILQLENDLMAADAATSLHQEDATDCNSEDDEEEQEIDTLLARDLQELSFEERNQAMFDLHGIIVLTPEEPAEIAQMLLTMEQEVRRIVAAAAASGGTGGNSTLAYAVAERMSWEYVHDPKLRIMFIRADRYDPIKAANRLVEFFDVKQALFGREKICKDITLMDLFEDDETRACLESCRHQRSRYRDASGRPIIITNCIKCLESSPLARQRVVFFVFTMAVTNDDDAQRRGIIWIIDEMDKHTIDSANRVREALPVSFGALHFCFPRTKKDSAGGSVSVYDSTLFLSSSPSSSLSSMTSPSAAATGTSTAAAVVVQKQLKGEDTFGNDRSMGVDNVCNWKKTVKTGMRQTTRVRVRKHYGTKAEIVQSLITYGIPRQVTSRAHIDTMQWLQSLLEKEFSNSAPPQMVNGGYPFVNSSWPNGTRQTIKTFTSHPGGNNTSTGGSLPSSQEMTFQGSRGPQATPMHTTAKRNCNMSSASPSLGRDSSNNNGTVAPERNERRSSRQATSQDTPTRMIRIPSADDILFGRSRISVDHPGNVRFKQLVEMNLDVYYSPTSTRVTKAQIARTIVRTLNESGGRFLRKVNINISNTDSQDFNAAVPEVEYWVEVDHKEAQAKVSHQFRNRRQKIKGKEVTIL